MALWKARSLSIEQNVQLVEDDPENESVTSEESVTLIGSGDVSMSEVQCCSLQVPVISLSFSLVPFSIYRTHHRNLHLVIILIFFD